MIDKVGNKIGSDGWQDADTQTAFMLLLSSATTSLILWVSFKAILACLIIFSPMAVGEIFFRSLLNIFTSNSSSSF